jgi:radical SAM superfamily enzyme YgiQ (UPF0313 family)
MPTALRVGLREPGAILLVSCYELGHQPLALAAPMGFLMSAGFRPAALDLAVEAMDADRVREARLVAISVPMHTALRLGVRAAARIRDLNPAVRICFYGLYATLNAEYLLRHGADWVIGGELEGALVELAEALDRGEEQPDIGGRVPRLERLPGVFPRREVLPPLERYARLEWDGQARLAGYAEASRGCKHDCLHCPIPPVYGRRFFVTPVEQVLEDIRRQVEAGARHIKFGDPDFLNGPGHAMRVLRAAHAEHPNLTFDFTAKIEHLLKHRALLPEMRALGCIFAVSAVESLSDTVLAHLKKGHTGADVAEALTAMRSAGIAMRPSLMPFTPWATSADYLDLLAWAAEQALLEAIDPVHYTIRLLIPPGSLLLESPAMRPHLGALDEAAFCYRWTHPDPRMDRLQREAAALVERCERERCGPRETHARLWELAHAVLECPLTPVPEPRVPSTGKPPRLTESWFC